MISKPPWRRIDEGDEKNSTKSVIIDKEDIKKEFNPQKNRIYSVRYVGRAKLKMRKYELVIQNKLN